MATNVAPTAEHAEEKIFENGNVDWSTSYAQLLSRSVANTQRSLKLYQQTLDYVSRGLLPATVFQEYYPRFVQKNGAAYGERLTRLGAEFLARLAQLNGRETAKPSGDDSEIPPPIFEPSSPTQWFEQYAEYAGRLNARAMRSYRRQLEQVAEGEVTPEEAQRKASEEMSRKMPAYLQETSGLYLKLLHDLDGLRGEYEEEYLSGILALTEKPAADPITTVVLRGPRGGVAFASFTVTNTASVRTPIRYIATEVRRMDGVGAAFAPKVAVAPEVLELGPGEEETITFYLQLDADRYEVGTPYIGFLYLTGEGDLRVEMQLRIVATEADSE